MRHTTAKEKVDIINSYLALTSMIAIAKHYQMSRQGVYQIIKAAGIDTRKTGGIEVSCYCCQKVIKKPRCQVRKAKHLFCNQDCYDAYLKAGNGAGPLIINRQGARIARKIIAQYFDIQPSHIPHHKDRNQLNNVPQNLMVFRCQGDHVRYHRGFEVEPLWDGSLLP